MISTFRNESTSHGWRLDEMKSGMQKYIRRGNQEKALYCVYQIDIFADLGKVGERIRTNMIHRLMIIFIEDVGLGNYKLWKYLINY